MPGMLGGVADVAARGFQWWTSELAGLVPGGGARDTTAEAASVIVNLDVKGALQSINTVKRGRAVTSASAGLQGVNLDTPNPEIALEQLAQLRPGSKVCIRLPHGACLQRQVEIPATAQHQAASILTLDFERSTPFKLSDVYVGHTLAPATGRKGWLSASQHIVKRKLAEHAIASIEDLGLKIIRIDCWSPDGKTLVAFDFLDKSGTAKVKKPSRQPLLLMSVIAVALTGSASWLGLSHRGAALQTLEAEVSAARGKAEAIRVAQSAIETAQYDITAVHALKASQPSAVEIVNELTHLLPDDIVLSDLKIEGDTVDFAGVAKSSAAVLPALERAGMFKDVSLTSPVTFDASLDKERFSMRLRLRHSSRTASVAAQTQAVPQ
jgi:general secretion pathway protein L